MKKKNICKDDKQINRKLCVEKEILKVIQKKKFKEYYKWNFKFTSLTKK
jgi:hypothetical protein